MTLHCPFCAASIELGPECHETHGVYRFPTVCPICKKALDVAAIMAALGFPLLGADERWRSETCGGCGFRARRDEESTALHGDCRRTPRWEVKDEDCPACAEWAERRGE